MAIFTQRRRTDAGPKLSRETEFEFTDRSARPEINRVREFLEALLSQYPESEHSELISRIKSRNDVHYGSAIFELLLHATLLNAGFSLKVHPELPGGVSSRPDFHVTAPDGSEFYLEATTATEQNEDLTICPLTARVLDELSTHAHENFLVGVKVSGRATTQPSSKRFISHVFQWLDTLDPDSVKRAESEGISEKTEWTHEGVSIVITAFPLDAQLRGKANRLLGAQSADAGWINPAGPIRNAVRVKGSKYGKLELPFVIAINFDGFVLDSTHEVDALYGDEVFVVPVGGSFQSGGTRRKKNGAWMGEGGPVYTRVSGVWIFDHLSPYSLNKSRGTLYFNPYASIPLTDSLKHFANAEVIDGRLRKQDGPTLGHVLGIEDDWLEEC